MIIQPRDLFQRIGSNPQPYTSVLDILRHWIRKTVRTLEDGGKHFGVLFFSLINVMFNGMAELAMTIFRLPVFYKQRDFLFYPAWALGLPIRVLRIPLFFKQFLAFFSVHQMVLSPFRLIASLGRTLVVANTLGLFTLLLIFVLEGLPKVNDIKPWMIWGYYISPVMYGQNAIVINEFLDKRWSKPNLNPRINEPTVGRMLSQSRGFFVQEYWYWICIGALFGFSLLFNIFFNLASTWLSPLGDTKAVVLDEEADKKKNKSLSSSEIFSTSENIQRRGMVLPFQPLSLAFNHVNYYVDMPAEMKSQGLEEDRLQLLRDVSSALRPGVLTALVGVSGAGKTILMDVLARRKTGSYIEGSINISGYPKNQSTFAQMFVEEVMELVELNPIRDTLVGLPDVDGMSTEQRKRLTIAVESVANPSIIFMDEPTSGLDARAAAMVMRTVRNTLLLMKRGGRVIYAGPLGRHSHKLVEYFEAVLGVPKIMNGYNSATWMLEVSASAIEAQLHIDFDDIYANSNLDKRNQELIKELTTPAPSSKDLYFSTEHSQPFLTQCKACVWKQHWSYWRNPQYNAIRFFMTIIVGILFGLIFLNKGDRTKQDPMSLLGAMTVFYRERAAAMYCPLPYAFAQVAIETIYVAIQTFVYSLFLYSMFGFEWKAGKFLWFYCYMLMCFIYFMMSGMMIAALTSGHQIVAIVMSFFLSFWNSFSGFLIPRPASPVAWTLYSLVTSQVGDKNGNLEIPGAGDMD
ncbi:hypothetical protein EUGRSUZ_D01157 [Eucalyptus grandis]|uniref:Uncharacterized protein n=2 Tax=Eucalyptus grandis TaxID=71139 RepID=A0ACC3L759_EUCGR|nr:hypothetical protein EUGRSUZ_D01157 [Eucalyptus grandis]